MGLKANIKLKKFEKLAIIGKAMAQAGQIEEAKRFALAAFDSFMGEMRSPRICERCETERTKIDFKYLESVCDLCLVSMPNAELNEIIKKIKEGKCGL